MNDQEIYLLLKQAGNSLQAIFDYFKKKNKILFDSSTSWDSGTKTIKDISKYNLIQVDLDLGGVSGIAIRRSDTVFTGTVNANYPSWMGVTAFLMSLNGDSCKLDWGWVNVNTPGAPNTTYGIKRIVGIEPIIPESLSNIIGGGYCLTRFLREGCIDYVQSLKESLRRYKKSKVLKANKEMGKDRRKLWNHFIQCGQIQRIAVNNIFRRSSYQDFYSCNNINKQYANAFCRDVQFRNLCEYKQNNHFSIQTTNWLHGRINSLRQIKEMGWCV